MSDSEEATEATMLEFKCGDAVMIDSFEGFGGPAKVIAIRHSPTSHYRVAMDDNNPPPFWAHDFEVSPIGGRPPESESIKATREHIRTVQTILGRAIEDIYCRSQAHDLSKLESPEAEVFEEYTPKLAGCTYGSEEYKSYLAGMKPALDSHYSKNDHHPEFWAQPGESTSDGNAIRRMSLLSLLEMLCDWLAATKRHNDGDIRRSIELNQKRFGYSDELKAILLNTLPVIEGA